MPDTVNHPKHYNSHPSGVEAIDVCEESGFNLGNAIKYLLRAQHKGNPTMDYEKALWYVERERSRRTRVLKYPSTERQQLMLLGKIIEAEPSPIICEALRSLWKATTEEYNLTAVTGAVDAMQRVVQLERTRRRNNSPEDTQ